MAGAFTRRAWDRRISVRAEEAARAADELLVTIALARREGVPHSVIAHALGGKHPTGMAAKAAKGEAILKEREKKNA